MNLDTTHSAGISQEFYRNFTDSVHFSQEKRRNGENPAFQRGPKYIDINAFIPQW
jgi:hypothetical protein